tara:strand:- start:845 stop:1396 length:552 start_codon:yes stop_codon:yes gene_type:complete
MIRYAILSDTGLVVGTGSAQTALAAAEASVDFGRFVLLSEGQFPTANRHYFVDDEMFDAGPAPDPWSAWDGSAWVDPRTEADLAAEMQARRDAASLTRMEFIMAAMAVNLLDPAEAAAAAQGLIPDSFQTAVATLSAYERDMVAIFWPSASVIERMHPILLAIASAMGIPDETLDEIFGLSAT